MRTRILPTGRSTEPASRTPPIESGFTLIELLVVVTIVGVLAGSVVLSIGLASKDRELASEAERLGRVMEYASSTAIFRGVRVALDLKSDGYTASHTGGKEWMAFPESYPMFRPHTLPSMLELHAQVPARSDENSGTRLIFLPEGLAEPAVLELVDVLEGSRAILAVSSMGDFEIKYHSPEPVKE